MDFLNKKTIVVVGATGNQGSSVARTFIGLSSWRVRCLTRNPSSPASYALAALGAEIVKADLSDPSSLSIAFEGANSIFLNTDFWATYIAATTAPLVRGDNGKSGSELGFDQEISHGKNAAIAAANVQSLEHLIYSALGPMKRHSMGRYPNSYHWDSKATIVEYIENEQPDLAKKASFIYLGAYITNPLLSPRLDPTSGNYTFVLPARKETRMPIIDPSKSTGPFVRALVESEKAGTKLLAYDSYLSIEEVVKIWSRVTGKEVVLVELTADAMHKRFGIPIEVLDAPGFIDEYGYTGGIEGVIEPSQLKNKVQTKSFEVWLKDQNLDKILGSAEAQFRTVQE